MHRITNRPFTAWPALTAMVVLAGVVTVALAQGSGSKSAGSGSKNEQPEKAEDKAGDKAEVNAELNAEALKAIMGAKVPVVLLDARGPSDPSIPGATPLAHDADDKAIRRTLTNRDQLIVTYCGGPECPMSLMLANRLSGMGYANVIRFTGGVKAWTEAGFELHKKDNAAGSGTKDRAGSSAKPSGSGTR